MAKLRAQEGQSYNSTQDQPPDSAAAINAEQDCSPDGENTDNVYYNKTYALTMKNYKVNLNLTSISKLEKKIYSTIYKCGFRFFTDPQGKCQLCNDKCSVCRDRKSECILCHPPFAKTKSVCASTYSLKVNYL